MKSSFCDLRCGLGHLLTTGLGVLVLFASFTAALAAGPGVHGRVNALDETGKFVGVVPGATIQFKGPGGNVVAQTTASETGYFKLDLQPGEYFYSLQAAGYKDEDAGRGIRLKRSEGYSIYNFAMVKGQNDPDWQPFVPQPVPLGTLIGRVYEETADVERPIAGAAIRLRQSGLRKLATVVTAGTEDDDGNNYRITLAAGTWQASVWARGFELLVDPDPIRISQGEETKRDFVLIRREPEPATDQGIRGLVRVLSAGDRVPPRPDIQMRIERLPRAGEVGESFAPDNRGQYSRELPSGRYRVIARAKGYHTAVSAPAYVFPERYTVVNLTLKPRQITPDTLYELLVLVQDAKTRTPIRGAEVLLRPAQAPVGRTQRAVTGPKGDAHFTQLGAGDYSAVARVSGYETGGDKCRVTERRNELQIALKKEQDDMPAPALADVQGYVVYKDPTSRTGYRGIPGTQLSWQRIAPTALAPRNATARLAGRYSLEEMAEGTYRVHVEPPAPFQGTTEQVVVQSGMRDKYFILQQREEMVEPDEPDQPDEPGIVFVTGSVSGLSSLNQRRPVTGAEIVFSLPGRSSRTLSGRDGRFSIRLPANDYMVAVRASGYEPLVGDKIHVRRGMRPVSLTLKSSAPKPPSEAELNLRIVERAQGSNRAKPLVGAKIVVTQLRSTQATGQSDTDGRFAARLKPGIYEINVSLSGYGSARERLTLVSGVVNREIAMTRDRPEPPKKRTLTVRVTQRPAQLSDPRIRTFAPVVSKPIAGAKVEVRMGRSARPLASGTTDNGGYYRVDLDPGSYSVKATASGFNPGGTAVAISTQNVTREIQLTPTQTPFRPQDTDRPRLDPARKLIPPNKLGPIRITPLPKRERR